MTLLDYLSWLIPLGVGFIWGWAFGLDAGRRSVVIALPAEKGASDEHTDQH